MAINVRVFQIQIPPLVNNIIVKVKLSTKSTGLDLSYPPNDVTYTLVASQTSALRQRQSTSTHFNLPYPLYDLI